MNSRRRIVVALLVVAVAGLAAALAGSVHAATKSGNTLVIWTDQPRYAAIHQFATQWAAKNGVSVDVVQQQFGNIESNLGTVALANAPDVTVAAHDWTGQLAANGLVVPIHLSKAQKKDFPAWTLKAFSYGIAVTNLYAVPTQIENIGLVVNTKEAKVPTTWKQLVTEALAWKHKHHTKVGIAVADGAPNGDPYHMEPLLTGLGGYVFGFNKQGNFDPSNIGLANKKFLKNAKLIDQWNKQGLISSSVDYNTAKSLFETGKVPFWIEGPWESQSLKQSGIKFRIVPVPKIVYKATPFLGAQGFMITKYAAQHGVSALAANFVLNYMTKPAAQLALAKAEGRLPASLKALKQDHDKVLAEFASAGVGGQPMPNISQMQYVWQYLGQAWVNSTKGANATKAATAFKLAAHQIAAKIG